MLFDPRAPEVLADPYPSYAALRELDPVHHVPSAGIWFVSRHADCRAVLTDPAFSAEQGQRLRARHGPLPSTMLSADPPEQGRLRGAVASAFSPAAMRAHKPAMRALVIEHINAAFGPPAAPGAGVLDVVSAVARPLSAAALAGLLGLGPEGVTLLATHAPAASRHLDPFARHQGGDMTQVATSALLETFADVLHERNLGDDSGQDALSVIAASFAAGRLSAAECLASAVLLVVGGFEPLADVVCSLVATLLDSGLMPPPNGRLLVEEVLRHDAPIQFTARRARTERVISGRSIPTGDGVVVLLGSANRDSARFATPDELQVGRRRAPHLSFGAGPHVCLGAPFVRLIGQLVVDELGRRALCGRPAEPGPRRRPSAVPRGYLSYPIEVVSSAST